MTSSDTTKPKYFGRMIGLAIFVVVLFGGYSLGWFYFAGKLVEQVNVDENRKIGGDQLVTVGGNTGIEIGGNQYVGAGNAQHVAAGTTMFLDAGMDIVLTAGLSISLNVGGNFVKIDPTGVTVNGILVNINSGGAASTGSPVTAGSPKEPEEYKGPHAKRYDRSTKS